MARYTKTKRPEKKLGVEQDIQQAEHIQSGLETFFEKLIEYKWLAIGALGALVLGIVAVSVITQKVHSSNDVVGGAINTAETAVKAIDAAEGDDARKAAVDKALAAIEPLLGTYAGKPAGSTLAFLKAAALLKGGRSADALPVLLQLKADPAAAPLALPVLLQTVQALKGKGDLEASAKAIDEVKDSSDLLARLVLTKLLGDLYNPFVGDAKNPAKDREKALHHYNEALALLKDRPAGKAGSTEEFYQNEIKKRIAFLKG